MVTPVTSLGSMSGRELHPAEREAQRPRHGFRQRCLPDAGHVLDQNMAVAQQSNDGQLNGVAFANDDPI